jgi:hypothetical protein
MARSRGRADGVAAAVRELAAADVVAFGGVGIAGQILPVTRAYQSLDDALRERPEDVRRDLDWLLARGSPAGKAYAANLLGRLDPAAGRAAWRSLTNDRSEFSTFTGCIIDRTKLSEYAARQLEKD